MANHEITGARHPRGTAARVLLSSVFGPYAQDDEYGSRLINPMELLLSARAGEFRLGAGRILAAEIQEIFRLLHSSRFSYPASFIRELQTHRHVSWDLRIVINLGKGREMCQLGPGGFPTRLSLLAAMSPLTRAGQRVMLTVKSEERGSPDALLLGRIPPIGPLPSRFGSRSGLRAGRQTTAAIIPQWAAWPRLPPPCFWRQGKMINFPYCESLTGDGGQTGSDQIHFQYEILAQPETRL